MSEGSAINDTLASKAEADNLFSEKIVFQDTIKNMDLDSNWNNHKDIQLELLKLDTIKNMDSLLTDTDFVNRLNAKFGVSKVKVADLVDEANKYSGSKKEDMIKAASFSYISLKENTVNTSVKSEKELEKLLKDSPGTAVINSIKSESLNKGLGVFEMLGFIAVACGLLLFVIGRPLKKWMHGIN